MSLCAESTTFLFNLHKMVQIEAFFGATKSKGEIQTLLQQRVTKLDMLFASKNCGDQFMVIEKSKRADGLFQTGRQCHFENDIVDEGLVSGECHIFIVLKHRFG